MCVFQAELRIHSENNSPFLTVTHLERVIEVSHWGNIAVEESIQIRHSGAELNGPFSRYDYQRTQDPGASVKSFKVLLSNKNTSSHVQCYGTKELKENVLDHCIFQEVILKPVKQYKFGLGTIHRLWKKCQTLNKNSENV